MGPTQNRGGLFRFTNMTTEQLIEAIAQIISRPEDIQALQDLISERVTHNQFEGFNRQMIEERDGGEIKY